ncbi:MULTISPECIES: NlpC/P60 family peptidoglycan endopeptidase RipA [Mycolicibacter]|uniref:Peptidase M23 n=1 Tax=Mycolicibacter virginiensis TaxID=1795032 RepID=A0A9X7NXF7_9MYCO|nr:MULTISPECIES: NlpC/P60 family peptidoglycan endopeptidase RipA [Mycolicibacter]OBG40102.1 peptidase M23 [Mycolicibacter heraklionensis]OBJ28829.1 peptidase M23 [Mycolicibacter heraklionensis]PQM50889.1 peptidase M23 [Mycolicibacter virginiensis]ULP45714.1 NlpC/P60 family peptidoglycan endopeptidase RipA [Mycolicibacter virginiensis]
MRRIRCGSDGSVFRQVIRVAQPATVSVLSAAMLLGTPGLAAAQPGQDPDGIAALIADVADANQQLQNLGAQIAEEKEGVNKALVDLQTARDDAAAAQQEVESGRQAIADADAAIAAAQRRFNTFAASTYVNGPSDSYLTAANPSEMIATAAAGQTLALSSQQALDHLKQARTEQLNKESAARLAKQKADQAVADAQSSQDAAVAALTDTQRKFGEQQGEIDRLAARRNAAQAKIVAARGYEQPQAGPAPAGAPAGDRWGNPVAGPTVGKPAQWDGPWDPTLPMVPSADVPGDPVAVINQVLGISQTSAQVTANLGQKFLQSLGLAKPDDTGINNGKIPRVYGRQASEYVIRRGLSQRGVPYSWGGGTAAGPGRGIGSGSGTVGFDCSGLILYAFAGVGIKLPHYSGSQYKMGRQIPSALARRGDVIFYGPGGSQHVTLYLGNGLMLEAPDVGQTVKVSPVRKSGMTPYVVRYIEY